VLTAREIVRSIYGVWRLARADPGGMAYFDATEEAFWRSFRVAILLLPLRWLALALQVGVAAADAPWARLLAIDLIAYAIGWMAYPVAAHYLVMALGREREYVGYIVAYNWSSMLTAPFQLVVLGLVLSGLLPVFLLHIVWVAMWAAVFLYAWFIAKTALRTGAWQATGFVVIDALLLYLLIYVESTMIL
jgi:hypothetical protein